jgi:hypothetical protein
MKHALDFDTGPMTYELAARLRDRGYPQPSDEEIKSGAKRGVVYLKPQRAYGPTIGELIGVLALGEQYKELRRQTYTLWHAEAASGLRVEGSSALEALANLWLALHPPQADEVS